MAAALPKRARRRLGRSPAPLEGDTLAHILSFCSAFSLLRVLPLVNRAMREAIRERPAAWPSTLDLRFVSGTALPGLDAARRTLPWQRVREVKAVSGRVLRLLSYVAPNISVRR